MLVPRFCCLRVRTQFAALTLALFLAWTLLRWRTAYVPANLFGHISDLTASHQKFWRDFHTLLEQCSPNTTAPVIENERAPTEGFKLKDAPPRPNYLHIPDDDVATLKDAHTQFVDTISQSPPQLSYIPDTKGVVTTAGGFYLPVLVISLRMLRWTGSTLPMEVFLADEDEYEEYICDQVLPSLNARCLVLSRILSVAPVNIEKYQYKPFAMLFSSFEEILFLDADAFPLEKPEVLFWAEPFLSRKMVTWPDFWGSSASPLFYKITGQVAPPMELRQSTESGELLISKKTHTRTLLLCTYYNYWGPSHYYPLLSQGAAGEGDKETFLAAASVMQEHFYQVSERICALGHGTDGGMAGSAMAQFNPIQDFALTSQGKWRVRGDEAQAPSVFFIHANFPKFNPATVFDDGAVNPAFADDGSYTRAWTIPESVVKDFSSKADVEKIFWQEILWTACELEDKFSTWRDHVDICAAVKDYWGAVFGDERLREERT
ncbi:hypothetical protein N7508_008074 [Penicillium antarcticum]|uniref:uncharacterized protein n=1 Tax=Penicillium antarcticum TaxID=416450 RepID=UPI0023826BFF|nr:uncharacterized protein N7508_008074 [Penicillium antarcticum]KAJ5297825.1 hypothetical protein N7508_008074 [Penicillium antarcticum]